MSESMPLMMNLQGSPAKDAEPAAASGQAEAAQVPFDGLLLGLFATLNDPATPLSAMVNNGIQPAATGRPLPGAGKSLPPAALAGPWSLLMVQDGAGQATAALAALQTGPAAVAAPGAAMDPLLATEMPEEPPAYRLLIAQLQWNADTPERSAALFERNMLQQLNPELLETVSPASDQEALPLNTAGNQHTGWFAQQGTNLLTGRPEISSPAIPVPPQHPQWGQALGERIQWLLGQNLQEAEIRLDPPELGSLDVKIQIHKDTATVSFVTQHAQVRDAVEAATTRLRDMLADVGLNLGDVNVSQESFSQQQMAEREQAPGGGAEPTAAGEEVASEVPGRMLRRSNGLLDTYA